MPILYIHGVNTRSRQSFENEIRVYLRRYVAPAISASAKSVMIEDVFWGDVAVNFAWNGASRPKSQLLGQGPDKAMDVSPFARALVANHLSRRFEDWPSSHSVVSNGGLLSSSTTSAPSEEQWTLSSLSNDELSDLLAAIIETAVADVGERTRLVLIADEAAHDLNLRAALAAEPSGQRQVSLLMDAIQQKAAEQQTLVGQGVGDWFVSVKDRMGEVVGRATSFPAYTASVVAAELRKPLNDLVSVFIGDVLHYLHNRGEKTSPGTICQRLLDKLVAAHKNKTERDGEPIVVLSHSMGGQVVYDMVSHFLPEAPSLPDMRIDFWCATASQVGFFEEAKLFLASQSEHRTGNPVPFPREHLGVWWNVWDSNDVLSFTVKDIFSHVDDELYDSGMSLLAAHGGYLQRPSFYRRFATKLEQAKRNGWSST
jgi:hypothetical protein